MRDDTQDVTPSYVDILYSHIGEYSRFVRFHTEIIGVAFECENGCTTPYGTPLRWVIPYGDPDHREAYGGIVGRFIICPACKSPKVKMLSTYPTIPRQKQYWFWDMTTYKKKEEEFLNG